MGRTRLVAVVLENTCPRLGAVCCEAVCIVALRKDAARSVRKNILGRILGEELTTDVLHADVVGAGLAIVAVHLLKDDGA